MASSAVSACGRYTPASPTVGHTAGRLGRWQPAIDAAMLGRFYERYADHAVSAARQVVYVVTGKA